ncbi:MAG: hypothetical protein IIB04_03640 [Acidobacteria bacterium]|nr:hypothetical protein [Acidobacteriota bacterium]
MTKLGALAFSLGDRIVLDRVSPVMKRRLFKPALVLAVISVSCATAAQLTPLSTPVSTRIAPASTSTTSQTAPVAAQSPKSPDLMLVSSDFPVRLGGFDYCWQAAGGESAVCADSFGTEVPLAATANDGSVDLEWMVGGTLTAWFRRDSAQCSEKLALAALGSGKWRLSLPEEPGTYRIDFSGEAPAGNTRFAVLMTSTVGGPASSITPSVDLSVSVAKQLLTVEAEFSDLRMGPEAAVEFRSADAVVSTWTMSLSESGPGCGRFFGIVEIEDITVVGKLPLDGLLVVDDGLSRFELAFRWPDDFVDSYVKGEMQRKSSK